MFKFNVSAALIIFFSPLLVSPVLAGGGPVYFNVEPSGPIRPGQQYIVRPVVSGVEPGSKCKGCAITIKFENPQSGDIINQSDSKTDDNGTMYAKVISQVTGERLIYAEVTDPADGATFQSSKYVLYFQEDPVPSGSITAKVTGQKSLGGNVRQVSLSWSGSSDQVIYYVFARPANGSYGVDLASTNNLNADITINTTPDYYAKVAACNGYGRCIESSEISISPMQAEATKQPVSTPTPSPRPTAILRPTIVPTATPRVVVRPAIAEVKVATSSSNSGQNTQQVINKEKSQGERQAGLQLQISIIVAFIKAIFRF